MERVRGKMSMVVAMMICAMVMMVEEVHATRWIVGANMGWTTNVNYTIWAKDKHFYNGDWLFFVYDRNQMNVLEVNKTDYESCNSDHPLHNWTTGAGRDVVPLNVTRNYYFISGKGFCFGGMKVAVHVENPPPPPTSAPKVDVNVEIPTPPPTPPPTSAPKVAVHVENPTPPPTSAPKVAVHVENPPPPPTSAPLNDKSAALPSSICSTGGQFVLPALFAIGAVWDTFVQLW